METDKNEYPVPQSKQDNLKGKISETGDLSIERAGKLKPQGCPTQEENYCGDWCPLFGEPKVSRWMGSPNPDAAGRENNPKHWDIKLCKRTLYFDELIDERKK